MFQTVPYNRGQFAVAAENPHLGAHESFIQDKDPNNTIQLRSNSLLRAMWAQNKTGGGTAILGSLVLKWATGFYKAGVVVAGLAEVGCGISDDFLPSGGVPDQNWFWIIREGSVTLTSDGSGALAQGNSLVTAAAGRVKIQVAAPADATAALVQINSKVGTSQGTVAAAAGTKFVAEVHFPVP